MSLGPVVSGPALSENKIVRPENLTKRTRSDAVHGSGFQVDQDRSGNILAAAGLVVIHVDPLKLQVRVAMVGTRGVDAMLIRDDLPELQRDESVIVGVPSTVSIIW